MRDLLPRILGALLYGGVMMIALVLPQPWLSMLFAILALGLSLELVGMQALMQTRVLSRVYIFLPAVLMLTSIWYDYPLSTTVMVSMVCIGWLLSNFYRVVFAQETHLGFLGSIVYIGLPLLGLIAVSTSTKNSSLHHFYMPLILYYWLIWSSDIFAYFVGRGIGRTPLAPAISPKKTIEGVVGGLVLGLAGLPFVAQAIGIPCGFFLFVVGGVTILAGVMGDLFESQLKRKTDIKDSGTILPGHGGLLDRMDAFLFAAPFYIVAYTYLIGW